MPVEVEAQPKRRTVTLQRSTTAATNLAVGAALWESVAGEWVLLKCGCAAGYEAGSPPSEPGAYEGQIVRKVCEPIAE
jgi:hypothetical protein